MSRNRKILTFIFILVIALSFFIVRLFIGQGEFQAIAAQSDYQCKVIESPYGPEDLIANYDKGLLYISASPREGGNQRFEQSGGIYYIDMKADADLIKPVTNDFSQKFRPHGMSLVHLENGKTLLFAISHPILGKTNVEIFNVDGSVLSHVKTVTDVPDGLNSIVAIDEQRFYATQDGHTRGSAFINGVFKLKKSEIIFFDGEKSNVVADGFVYANGLELSADGSQLFVTDTIERTLVFYDRNQQTNGLTKSGDLYLDAGGDNIRRNQDGSLYIAGHPKMITTFSHMQDISKAAPSVVFHAIPPKDGKGGELRVVYLEDGSNLSGASGAVQFENKMYVGTISDHKILSCIQ